MTEADLLTKQAELVAFLGGTNSPVSEALTQVAQLTLCWAVGAISGDEIRRAINNLAINTTRRLQNGVA